MFILNLEIKNYRLFKTDDNFKIDNFKIDNFNIPNNEIWAGNPAQFIRKI